MVGFGDLGGLFQPLQFPDLLPGTVCRGQLGSVQPGGLGGTFCPWGHPCAQTQHPRVKIEMQLPICGQCELPGRVTSLPGKSQHVQASPGRWQERDTFCHPDRTPPSPPRLFPVPLSPSSGHRRDSGATLEPQDNTLALTHGCRLPKPPAREGPGPGHRPLPWGWCRFQRPLPSKSFEAPAGNPKIWARKRQVHGRVKTSPSRTG